MKKAPLLIAFALVLCFAVAFLLYRSWRTAVPAAPRGAEASGGLTAPPFSLPDVSGNHVASSRFAGKPTAINFFATWCPPCREEIPGFVEVYNKYRERGFELVGISLDTDTRGDLPQFLMQNRIGYRILLGDIATARAYGGVTSIPTTFFVGKDGRIKNVHVGYMDREAFDREVQKLL
ncbi:MAG: TlpA family protein disulfide reductase [Deltaproteobacteria bacterium]|nr:TlpA family protein disulfide reductase [Deltaproteobacteria bacterium]